MFRTSVAVWCVVALGACSSPQEPNTLHNGEKVDGAPEAECALNSDCGITCYNGIGDCCGDLCQCSQPATQKSMDEARAWQDANCSEVDCPVADCEKPMFDYHARCEQGVCIAHKTAIEEM